ncbi:MAG: hypothetical protein ABSB83_02975 [Methanomassiliicoccales archaeon]|jgi:hypothetical protein
MDEDALLGLLSKEKKKEFLREKASRLRQVEAEFEKGKNDLLKRFDIQLETDKRHRDMVNCCIFPFSSKVSQKLTDYRFARASPLSELDRSKNMDFMLQKRKLNKASLIFGECKGGDRDAADKVKEVLKKVEAVEDNLDHVAKTYVGLPRKEDIVVEYTIVVPEREGPRVINEVIDQGGRLIVWTVPLTGKAILRSQPPHRSLPNTEGMKHKDAKLKRLLDRGITTDARSFALLPDMPAVLEQMVLIQVLGGQEGNERTIDKTALNELLGIELFYLDEAARTKKAEDILIRGKEIGFVKEDKDTGQLRVVAKSSSIDKIEQSLIDKWVADWLKGKLREIKDKAVQQLVADWLQKERRPGESLDYYLSNERKQQVGG